MRGEIAGAITELDGDPGLVQLLGASIEGNVDTILHALAHGIGEPHFEPPVAAIEYARRLAQRGVPVNALVRAYRLGQQHLLQRAFVAGADLEPAVRAGAYSILVDRVFDYIDWISQRVVAVYEEERESWLANQLNEREGLVRRILHEGSADPAAAERALGYRLHGSHLAVIASEDRRGQLTRSTRLVRDLAAALGSPHPPLVVSHDQATTWAWIQVPTGVGSTGVVCDHLDGLPSGGPVLAVGGVRRGVEGFRASHAEAASMHRVLLLRGGAGRPAIAYDEPGAALAGLLVADVPALRRWVVGVLGDLARRDEATERQRRTLLTFLRCRGSYTATAEQMTMHKNSIKYRVAVAEKTLGRSIAERHLDLEVALTMADHVGDAVLGARDTRPAG
nr:helix-turn-helix domain-containing protein [Nocardioides zeae]